MSVKPAAQSMLSFVAVLYIYSSCAAGAYFNYEYARDNGLVSWLTLGQVIPTIEGAIWPYFAVRHHLDKRRDEQEEARLDHSARADSVRRVLELVPSVQSLFQTPLTSRADSLHRARLLRASLAEIESVSPSTLNDVYPGWGDAMRDGWLPAVRNMAKIIDPDTLRTVADLHLVASETVAEMTLYDHWTKGNIGGLLKALFEKRIVQEYTDSAGTVHK